MNHLIWSFDWPMRKAMAKAAHGTYLILGEGPGAWSAKFIRSETEPYRRSAKPLTPGATRYADMAEAMHACQRHAESFSPGSSDRLTIVTPLPT